MLFCLNVFSGRILCDFEILSKKYILFIILHVDFEDFLKTGLHFLTWNILVNPNAIKLKIMPNIKCDISKELTYPPPPQLRLLWPLSLEKKATTVYSALFW